MTVVPASWKRFEQFHNIERVGVVEVGGGFVGNQQAGLVNDGAGDAQALLFTAGEGYGIVSISSFRPTFSMAMWVRSISALLSSDSRLSKRQDDVFGIGVARS